MSIIRYASTQKATTSVAYKNFVDYLKIHWNQIIQELAIWSQLQTEIALTI
jgi:hypothetical protein